MTTMSRPGSGTAECTAMGEPSGGGTRRGAVRAGGVVLGGGGGGAHPVGHLGAVRPVTLGVGAAVEGQAVLGVGPAGGRARLVGGGVGFAGRFVLPGVPPGAGGFGGGRVGDVNNG